MTQARPVPVADARSAPYWEAAARHELALQHCGTCDLFQHPPGPLCRRCRSPELSFRPTSGRGTIYTFTVTYHAFAAGFELPLPIVLVALDEQPGVRVLANVRGVEPADLAVGMPVEVVFEELRDGPTLPQFRVATGR